MTTDPFDPRTPDFESILRLAESLVAGRRVEFLHRDEHGVVTTRAVDPLALTYVTDHWNLAAWCHLRGDLRTFRVDRIRSVLQLLERANPGPLPVGPVPQGSASSHYFHPIQRADAVRATVKLTGRALRLAPAFFPQALLEFPSPDQVLCHLQATDLWALANITAEFASDVELIYPPQGAAYMLELRLIPF